MPVSFPLVDMFLLVTPASHNGGLYGSIRIRTLLIPETYPQFAVLSRELRGERIVRGDSVLSITCRRSLSDRPD
jgi:hypothetical protein